VAVAERKAPAVRYDRRQIAEQLDRAKRSLAEARAALPVAVRALAAGALAGHRALHSDVADLRARIVQLEDMTTGLREIDALNEYSALTEEMAAWDAVRDDYSTKLHEFEDLEGRFDHPSAMAMHGNSGPEYGRIMAVIHSTKTSILDGDERKTQAERRRSELVKRFPFLEPNTESAETA
jgi:hypothetical protein